MYNTRMILDNLFEISYCSILINFPLEYTNDGSEPGGISRKSLKKMVIASHRNDRHFLKRSGTSFFSIKAEIQGKNFSRLAAKLKNGWHLYDEAIHFI